MSGERDGASSVLTTDRWTPARARWTWVLLVAVLVGALGVGALDAGGPSTPAQRARSVGQSIKCPQCAGQSVADSDATAARAIRTEISRQIGVGRTDDQIRQYFADRYGDEILLSPRGDGLTGLVWFLPVAASVAAFGGLFIAFRRWRTDPVPGLTDDDRVLVEQARGRLRDTSASGDTADG